jgi:hypothetical protein
LPAIAAIQQLAWADGDHLPALGFFTGRIRQHDPTGRGFLGFQRLHYDPIIEWTQIDFRHVLYS